MIKFIDANCMIGRRNVCREGAPARLADFVEIMDRCGIEKAVVYHSIARENHMLTGNQCLETETDGSDRFLRQWAVMPDICGEFMPESQLLSAMKRQGIKTVRMFPAIYDHSLRPYASGRLLRALAEAKVAIFIEKSQLSWEELYLLCTTYPEARFVLCDPGYRSLRQLVPILEACDNLLVETSTYLMHNGIRDFCRRFGAERMIFGTGMPVGSGTAAVSMVRYADISEEEKQQIASGNILRLLGEVSL